MERGLQLKQEPAKNTVGATAHRHGYSDFAGSPGIIAANDSSVIGGCVGMGEIRKNIFMFRRVSKLRQGSAARRRPEDMALLKSLSFFSLFAALPGLKSRGDGIKDAATAQGVSANGPFVMGSVPPANRRKNLTNRGKRSAHVRS